MSKNLSSSTHIEDYMIPDPKDVTIFQSWETIDGIVYWKWRAASEKDWHYKKTAYKESPIIEYRKMTQEEYKLFIERNKEQ